MQKLFHLKILLLFTIITVAQETQLKAIKAGRMIDVVSGNVRNNQIILIENNIIKKIGENIEIPKNATIYDLSQYTVMPGFIDCHTHLTSGTDQNYYDDIFRNTAVDVALKTPILAKSTLMAGFTTVRDLGASDLIDISLRNAINKGYVIGPRMYVATFMIGATGGHADMSGFNPSIKWSENPDFTGVADGADEIRKRVRNNIKFGADVIKFAATAGVLSEEESVGAAQYSLEEMKVLVDEAHRWGKKVAAHAHGTEGIILAVKAGVNSIEHGSLIDETGIKLMKENGTYLVSDIYNDDYILSEYAQKGYPEKIINKEKQIGRLQRENFQKAVKAGVKIAFGSDAGVYPHGWNGKQFFYMVKFGLTPLQTIQSATINASDLIGIKEFTGSISEGKWADIIAVKGNPLEDVKILENISYVMKDGVVYKNE